MIIEKSMVTIQIDIFHYNTNISKEKLKMFKEHSGEKRDNQI